MNAVATTPSRSREQRMEALRLANEIRVKRAAVKQTLRESSLATARIKLRVFIVDTPDWLATMKVEALLKSLPRFGSAKTTALLRSLSIAQTKTVGGLSSRQREMLARELAS